MYVTVEGDLDALVARRILKEVGVEPYRVDAEGGKTAIRAMMPRICEASRTHPWFVLVDLDRDDCPGGLVEQLASGSDVRPIIRVAVREIEAWLMADRASFARYMGVSVDLVPLNPEALDDPKQYIVNLAPRSSKRAVRVGIGRNPKTLRHTGPDYNMMLGNYASNHWDLRAAANASGSLERCIRALRGVC